MAEATIQNEQMGSFAGSSDSDLQINRREFLNLAWLGSLGFLTLSISGVTVLFGLPRFQEGEFGGIFDFGLVSELPGVEGAPVNLPKVKLWISNNPDGLLALYKVCPHLGCIYGWNEQEFKFICPCHGSQYEHDGTYISGPAPRSLDRFVIVIEDENGQTLVQTPEDGAPVRIPTNLNSRVHINTSKKILGETHT